MTKGFARTVLISTLLLLFSAKTLPVVQGDAVSPDLDQEREHPEVAREEGIANEPNVNEAESPGEGWEEFDWENMEDPEKEAAEKNAEALDDLEEKYKNMPRMYTDAELDVFDQGWQNWELEQKIVFCKGLAQSHMHEHRETYEKIAEAAGTSKGIRSDDALRTLMFGSLLSCYFKVQKDEVHSRLSPERMAQVVLAAGDSPTRMSAKQMSLLEKVLDKTNEDMKRFEEHEQAKEKRWESEEKAKAKSAESKASEPVAHESKGMMDIVLGGAFGKALGFAVIGGVGALLYWGTMALSNLQAAREVRVIKTKHRKHK